MQTEEIFNEGDRVEIVRHYKSERGNSGAHYSIPEGARATVRSVIFDELVLEQFHPEVFKINCDKVDYCSVPASYVRKT